MINATEMECDFGGGFRDVFSKIMRESQVTSNRLHLLKADWIDTPLGPMMAIGDEKTLYLLEFITLLGLELEIERIQKKLSRELVLGRTTVIDSIEKELQGYFQGALQRFVTPITTIGTSFQKKVWQALQKIPFGHTCSYADIAKKINNPKAVRAVGTANGANQLAIIIPCHRVINTNGELGGYAGGVARKKWFLEHEAKYAK